MIAALFVAAGVGLVLLVRRAPQPPRLASLAFLAVAAFLLVNKVWSPQYSLWLVPLAVLALPRWRLLLAWMTLDALVWVPRMFYYVGPGAPRVAARLVPRRRRGPRRAGRRADGAGGAQRPAARDGPGPCVAGHASDADDPEWPAAAPTSERADARLPALSSSAPR